MIEILSLNGESYCNFDGRKAACVMEETSSLQLLDDEIDWIPIRNSHKCLYPYKMLLETLHCFSQLKDKPIDTPLVQLGGYLWAVWTHTGLIC